LRFYTFPFTFFFLGGLKPPFFLSRGAYFGFAEKILKKNDLCTGYCSNRRVAWWFVEQ